jgi:DNA-binding response OmpR family regulator
MQKNAVAAELIALLASEPGRAVTRPELARRSGRSPEEVAAACSLLAGWGLLHDAGEAGVALAADGRDRGGSLVLVAENTATVAHVVGALLESEGYRALIAQTLDLGTQVARAVSPDLVIADSFASTARQAIDRLTPLREAAAGAPVLLFTAHRDLDQDEVRDAGYGGLLPKPFDIDDLLARVAEAIAGPNRR